MIIMSFAGRIGKDAETRTMGNGDPVTSFSVGCNAGKDKTVWVNCAIFGDRGPKLEQYLKKGTPVAITGRPSARGWEKNGSINADLQCAVDQISLLGSKSDQSSGYGGGASGGGYGAAPQGGPSGLDDEIPFGPEVR